MEKIRSNFIENLKKNIEIFKISENISAAEAFLREKLHNIYDFYNS